MRRLLETNARFECPSCAKRVEAAVVVPEPHWGASENISEWRAEDDTEVKCPNCNKLFPAHASNGSSSCHITLDDYPTTEVDADLAFYSPSDDDDDIWDDYELPEHPFTIFMDSYHHTGDILADHGDIDGSYLLNRMVFAHLVGALEAYLGDTLTKTVLGSSDAMSKLMHHDKDLAKQKFTLADIASEPDIITKQLRKYLRSILYHNLSKVEWLYKTALGIRIFDENADKTSLYQAVVYRHDCVHRNGFDSDGNKLTIFTKEYIQRLADEMKDFVAKIEKQIVSYTLRTLVDGNNDPINF